MLRMKAKTYRRPKNLELVMRVLWKRGLYVRVDGDSITVAGAPARMTDIPSVIEEESVSWADEDDVPPSPDDMSDQAAGDEVEDLDR